eukprot:TRINITY_DN1962_c0_g2_i12.p1 TRINITY_DN1962_c0_g2~~TRINITY_DN1962_c0_g2_i12.p1  ORF type:complete len:370 (+),score=89.96 TRINITY_DN1962_c0_g2_i12:811-1920(+)
MAPTSHQTTSYHSHSLLKSWVPEMIIDDGGPHEDDGRMVMVMVVMRMMVKVMEDKAKNLQFEKATIVEQINSAFTELTRLSSLLEEVKNNSRLRVAQLTEVSGVDDLGLGSGGDEDLIQQLIKENSIYMDLKKENVELKQKIMLLEDQLSLLQEHNHSFDKYLIREKEKISVLETEKGALNDVYQTSLNHQCTLSTQFSVLERKLRFMNQKFNALEVGNPKFAMSQLESHSSHMFVHACTRLVEKQQLLKEALGTANPDIIIFVVAYLHFSLPSDLFDAVVMAKEEASTYYLNYLKNCNPTLFKHVTMRNGKISELGMFYFETALTEQDVTFFFLSGESDYTTVLRAIFFYFASLFFISIFSCPKDRIC